jgi:hypothetical protein
VIAEDFFLQFDHKNLLAGDAPARYRKLVLEPGGSTSRTIWSRTSWAVRRTCSRCKNGWQKNSRARAKVPKRAESEPVHVMAKPAKRACDKEIGGVE